MTNYCWLPLVARYNKKDAYDLVKRLKKFPKMSVQPTKPLYKVKHEKYQGKYTDRWVIWQDCKSRRIVEEINK